MIGRLLTEARLDMADTSPQMRPTDLKQLLADIVEEVQPEALDRNCRVGLVSDGDCYGPLLRAAPRTISRRSREL